MYNSDSTLVLKFITPDTINIATTIDYTNMQGVAAQKLLSPSVDTVLIADYQPGTSVWYQSSIFPWKGRDRYVYRYPCGHGTADLPPHPV